MRSAIRLDGLWDEGYALDLHTTASIYEGEDAFGNQLWKNSYTHLGQLLHSFKYNGRVDTSREIIEISSDFLIRWMHDKNLNAVIPTPPSAYRVIQPVYVIAEAVAQCLGVPYSENVLEKTSKEQAKNMQKGTKDLTGTIIQHLPAKRECNILLIDDIFSTGVTATECVSVLRKDPLIRSIYYLAITKTRT